MSQIEQILTGLGGLGNVIAMEPCITRLRAEVHDPTKVDEQALRNAGCYGTSVVGTSVQVIVGPQADRLASELEAMEWSVEDGSGRAES